MSTDVASPTKVVTGIVRFSYLQIFQPAAMNEGQDKKYSVSLIIPKSDKKTIAAIKAAIAAAEEDGKAKKFGGKLKGVKNPFHDGDEDRPDDEAYANSYYINASSKTKPGIVDKDCNVIMDQDEVYSGCYGRASINFYPYNAEGAKGIAAGLNNLMKVKDGEPLGGKASAESDFKDFVSKGAKDEDDEEDDIM